MSGYEDSLWRKAKNMVVGESAEDALKKHHRDTRRLQRRMERDLEQTNLAEKARRIQAEQHARKGNLMMAHVKAGQAARERKRFVRVAAASQTAYNEQVTGHEALLTHQAIECKRQATRHMREVSRNHTPARTGEIIRRHEYQISQLEANTELVMAEEDENDLLEGGDDISVEEYTQNLMEQIKEKEAGQLSEQLMWIEHSNTGHGRHPPPNDRVQITRGGGGGGGGGGARDALPTHLGQDEGGDMVSTELMQRFRKLKSN